MRRIIPKSPARFYLGLLIPSFLFLFTLLIYVHNLARGIYGGDVGDFVSAISVIGVPHPSGYPLMVVLGILANMLPFSTPAWRVGLVSACASSLSIVFCYLLVERFVKSRITSIVTALFLAFIYLFWLYSEIAEVFSLNILFVLSLLYFAYIYHQTKKTKYLYILALLMGLSLANHQTIILLVPSLLILILHKHIFRQWRQIVMGILFVLLGLCVYLYIPWAASRNPAINWDKASTLHNFIRLVLRQDYGTFSSSANGLSLQGPLFQRLFSVKVLFEQLVLNLTPIGSFISLTGLVYLFIKRQWRLFAALILGFVLSGPLFIAYSGFPLNNDFSIGVTERFFLMPFTLFLLGFPFGLLFLKQMFAKTMSLIVPDKTRLAYYQILFLLLFLLIPFLLLLKNFPKTNLSKVTIGDAIAQDLLEPLPKNSILFLTGDITIFNTAYLQYSLGVRPDIHAVNLSAPSMNEFYITKHDEIVRKHHLAKNDDFNGMTFLAKNYPIYSIAPLKIGTWVPSGLVYRLVIDKANIPTEKAFLKSTQHTWKTLHVPYPKTITQLANHNLTIAVIPSYYSQAAVWIGTFLVSQYNDISKAKEYFNKAVAIYPQEKGGYRGLGYIALTENKCDLAKSLFERVSSLDPSDTSSWVLLYSTYATCYHNNKKAAEVAAAFRKRYGMTMNTGIQNLLKENAPR